jgi:hypothetical protein
MEEENGKLHSWPYNFVFVLTRITARVYELKVHSHAVHRVSYEKKRRRRTIHTLATTYGSGGCLRVVRLLRPRHRKWFESS